MQVAETHVVLGTPMKPPFDGMETAMFALGCFWGAERIFWRAPGVHSTAVGYAGGKTKDPTYHEVCSGQTDHAEVVRVVFDAKKTNYQALVRLFWESHDPTQGNRQGHDVGTQYRSGIYCTTDEQRQLAEASRAGYQAVLSAGGLATITTEIASAPEFYYAEDYHQQYLEKNPDGYCGIGGTGLKCEN